METQPFPRMTVSCQLEGVVRRERLGPLFFSKVLQSSWTAKVETCPNFWSLDVLFYITSHPQMGRILQTMHKTLARVQVL